MPDYDSMSLSEIFKLDCEERIKTLNELVLKLEKEPKNETLFDDAMREAHSLKAAARIVNNSEVQSLAHSMEEVFEIVKKNQSLNSDYTDLFLENLDAITEMANAFVAGKPHGIDVEYLLERLEKSREAVFVSKTKAKAKEQSQPAVKKKKEKQKSPPASKASFVEARDSKSSDHQRRKLSIEKAMVEKESGDLSIRVGIERLDKLMNLSGEIYTNALNLERERDQLRRLSDHLTRITSNFDVLQDLLKEEEIQSRKFEEWSFKNQTHLTEFEEMVSSYLERVDHMSVSFGYLGIQMQDEVMRSRMLPASTIFQPFVRFVRDASRQSGKKIHLSIQGGDTPVDRGILEVLKDPLTHLVRNVCDHGIELPKERLAANKKDEGELTLSAYHQGDRIMIMVEDDGRGIDVNQVKETIIEKEFTTPEKIDNLSTNEILNFVFLPGFSTARKVTTLSGRGVGLDVVKSNLNDVDGKVQLESEPGKCTRFILSLPLTLSVAKCLLVECCGETFCIPLTRIEEVYMVLSSDIKTVEGRETLDIRGDIIPIVQLSQLWHFTQQDSASAQQRQLVVIGQGQERIALSVDKYLGEKEVVSKSLDKRLSHCTDVSGATVLDNGQVALIVDVESLIQSCGEYTGKRMVTQDEEVKGAVRKKILVVEDSLTVRELEKKMLQNHGYDVDTAVDGLEGYNKIKENQYDLIATDIEMPRMNGFELISLLKKDERLKNIPTIIVSFKEREEDKRKGMEVGADKYLTKSKYDDEILLEAIEKLIGR